MTAQPPADDGAPTVDPMRAIQAYQTKVAELTNDVIMRDVLVTELTETVKQLRTENQQLREQQALPQAG